MTGNHAEPTIAPAAAGNAPPPACPPLRIHAGPSPMAAKFWIAGAAVLVTVWKHRAWRTLPEELRPRNAAMSACGRAMIALEEIVGEGDWGPDDELDPGRPPEPLRSHDGPRPMAVRALVRGIPVLVTAWTLRAWRALPHDLRPSQACWSWDGEIVIAVEELERTCRSPANPGGPRAEDVGADEAGPGVTARAQGSPEDVRN